VRALQSAATTPEFHRYPSYSGLPQFREAIAAWYQQEFEVALDSEQQVLPFNGSKQAIVYATLAFAGTGDEVLIPNPGYSAYEKAAQIAGATPVFYELKPEHHFLPDLTELAQRDLRHVKVMWINYPHNPTGAVASLSDLQTLAEFAQAHDIILINDNPYSHITFENYRAPSLLQVNVPNAQLIELSSLSKTYNMPGWRIGWGVGKPELIAVLKNIFSNIETGQFIPLHVAAVEALHTPAVWIAQRNRIYADRRQLVIQLLEGLGCKPLPTPATLYVWAKLPPSEKSAEDFVFRLLEETGIFLAPGTAFGPGGEGYVRAAICAEKEMLTTWVEKLPLSK
jgi:aspartate/methionine/tyrosine aminotransferase